MQSSKHTPASTGLPQNADTVICLNNSYPHPDPTSLPPRENIRFRNPFCTPQHKHGWGIFFIGLLWVVHLHLCTQETTDRWFVTFGDLQDPMTYCWPTRLVGNILSVIKCIPLQLNLNIHPFGDAFFTLSASRKYFSLVFPYTVLRVLKECTRGNFAQGAFSKVHN